MEQIFEGSIFNTAENVENLKKLAAGQKIECGVYVEQRCVAYRNNMLQFEFGANKGVMSAKSASLLGQPKNTGFLVNTICGFYVTGEEKGSHSCKTYTLSRKAPQRAYFKELCKCPKFTVLDGVVSSIRNNTAFVDVGYGLLTVIFSADASILRVHDLNMFFKIGEHIKVLLLETPTMDDPYLHVSHKELLGTWEQNAKGFKMGDIVQGRVTTTHDYGTFIALTCNITALSDPVWDSAYTFKENDLVSITIKSIIPESSKIKCRINTVVPPVPAEEVYEKVYYTDYPFAEKGGKWYYNETNKTRPYVVDLSQINK